MKTQLHKLYLTTKQVATTRWALLDHIHQLERLAMAGSEEVTESIQAARAALKGIDLLVPPVQTPAILMPNKELGRGIPKARRHSSMEVREG